MDSVPFFRGAQGAAEYIGIIRFVLEYEQSKSERMQATLFLSDARLIVFKQGDNPFIQDGLRAWDAKHVRCSGTWQRGVFVLENIEEVEQNIPLSCVDTGATKL
jgi:hypothetical protein